MGDRSEDRLNNQASAQVPEVDTGRRAFLRSSALVGAGGAVAAVALPGAVEAQRFPPEPGQTVYRVTPHIERFYALNRL